jgi:hypothetical protein
LYLKTGVAFEASLFGVEQIYMDDQDPKIGEPVLQHPDDLNHLQLPDFHKSGLMPEAHRMYEELSGLVKDHDLQIKFPDWDRSPFATAHRLRGEGQLLVDMLERPDFVAELLDFLTQAAVQYRSDRARFLGIALNRPQFSNDEVNVPSISPKLYREVVLPREKTYAAAFGGLMYWHSCGNVTPMLPAIRETPGIEIFNVGPWTDIAQSAEVFGDVALDICMHPLDIYDSDEAMRDKVRGIVQTCWRRGAHSFSLRAAPFLALGSSVEEQVAAGARWIKTAKETVAELVSRSASQT